MALRALQIEQSIPVAQQMRDRFGKPWDHAVEQGRMFGRTYLALAHRERGGVAKYLDSRQTRFKFRRDSQDWMNVTVRAAAALQTADVERRPTRPV
jgi:hypothetical protein